MNNRIVYRTILALPLIMVVVLGSTGFQIETHDCQHCGADVDILLYKTSDKADSCCSIKQEKTCCNNSSTQQDASGNDGKCNLNTEECCSYETDSYTLDYYLVTEKLFHSFGFAIKESKVQNLIHVIARTEHVATSYYNKNCGKHLSMLYCCYLT